MCYDGVCSEDTYYDDYSSGHDNGYTSGYDDGYQSGRESRDWEIEDLSELVDSGEVYINELASKVDRLSAALIDAGVHPNLVEAIANG